MKVRSWLFVPADSEKKLAKAAGSGADIVILDLEDSVAPERKRDAQSGAAAWLSSGERSADGPRAFVRINPLDEGGIADLSAVVRARPDGIVQPKICGPADILRLAHGLDVLEAREGIDAGSIQILPIITETAVATLSLSSFAGFTHPRLAGLTWGAEDLATVLGATTNRDAAGRLTLVYRHARAMTLLAARAVGVPAIDTVATDFRDLGALETVAQGTFGEGFSGQLLIHPAQVPPVNAAFQPSAAMVEHARRVVAAFAAAPGAGTIGLDGKMVDVPHLKQARLVMAAVED